MINKSDASDNAPEMVAAKKREICELLSRGTFKVLLQEELPDGTNALTARFILAIKQAIDGEIKYKARYVIGRHRYSLQQFIVHTAQTLQAA